MSVNCIECVVNDRTSPRDMLCDRCRELNRLKSFLALEGRFSNDAVRWLIAQLDKCIENLVVLETCYSQVVKAAVILRDVRQHHAYEEGCPACEDMVRAKEAARKLLVSASNAHMKGIGK